MFNSDYVQFQKLIDTHKARLLAKLDEIKGVSPLTLECVKSQFFFMLKDLDQIIKQGKINDNAK